MAAKRRCSGSAGADGLGLFGVFLALGAVWVLVQYWWVLLIALGVVVLTVALVRSATTPTPPARARPQKPASPPTPRPGVHQPGPAPVTDEPDAHPQKPASPPTPRPGVHHPGPALVNDDLAVQIRAIKQVRRIRDMQEW